MSKLPNFFNNKTKANKNPQKQRRGNKGIIYTII